jgi:hypothetical protein
VLARWSAKDVRLLEADLGRAPEAAGEIALYNQELGLARA